MTEHNNERLPELLHKLPSEPSARYYEQIKHMPWYDEGEDQMEQTTKHTIQLRRIAAAAAAALIVLALAGLTPAGRAAAGNAWDTLREVVAGLAFTRQDVSPGAGMEADLAPTEFISAAEAQAAYGYALPTTLEVSTIAGYNDGSLLGEGEAMVIRFPNSDTVMMNYLTTDGVTVFVHIEMRDDIGRTLGTQVEIEEVSVNGQPAALYPTGAFGPSGYVTSGDSLTLRWKADGFTYEIRSTLSAEELIAIAESFE